MNLDTAELEIALMALHHMKASAVGHSDGLIDSIRQGGVAWLCCEHVAGKCVALIERIKQHQKDQENDNV